MLVSKQQALDYHNGARPGKLEITPTKPCRTQRDLSLAYTPGGCGAVPGDPQQSAGGVQVHRAGKPGRSPE